MFYLYKNYDFISYSISIFALILGALYFLINGIIAMYIFDDRALRRKSYFLQGSLFIALSLFGTIGLIAILLYIAVIGLYEWFIYTSQIRDLYRWYFTDHYKVIKADHYEKFIKYKKRNYYSGMSLFLVNKAIKRFEEQNPGYVLKDNTNF